MKGILVLLVLLSAQTAKVCSQPYKVDSDGNCRNQTSEYTPDDDSLSNLCCKKCRPGERLKTTCTETSDTVCEPCGPGLYMENWNYATNCFACDKCRSQDGLVSVQECSPTTKARCKCMPGMYCSMDFEDPYCRQCRKYNQCKPGFGVVSPGKANANVRCKPCIKGTFSDTLSDTDRCQPHTKCDGSAVVREGNTTSDTVCERPSVAATTRPPKDIKAHETSSVFMTSSTMNSTVLAVSHTPTLPEVSSHSTKSPPAEPDINLVAVIAGVAGIMLLFIFILLMCLCKRVWKKDNTTFHPKVDANGNCESGDKINHSYVGETQLAPMKVYPSEEQCLLGNGEACSDHSLSNNNTESLTQTEGCNSQESIGPLQSTVALDNSCSALSEPMSLVSNTEPVTPLPSGPSQSPCQPTSPQIISPITTSPHVNVNITFHIGNGSGGMPSVIPTNLTEADCKLPFGEEEKYYSIPQQEDGKRSQISVPDSESSSL